MAVHGAWGGVHVTLTSIAHAPGSERRLNHTPSSKVAFIKVTSTLPPARCTTIDSMLKGSIARDGLWDKLPLAVHSPWGGCKCYLDEHSVCAWWREQVKRTPDSYITLIGVTSTSLPAGCVALGSQPKGTSRWRLRFLQATHACA